MKAKIIRIAFNYEFDNGKEPEINPENIFMIADRDFIKVMKNTGKFNDGIFTIEHAEITNYRELGYNKIE